MLQTITKVTWPVTAKYSHQVSLKPVTLSRSIDTKNMRVTSVRNTVSSHGIARWLNFKRRWPPSKIVYV